MSVSESGQTGCTVVFEYRGSTGGSVFVFGVSKPKVEKLVEADILVLEEEKTLQITDGRTKSAVPRRFSLTKFVLYNAHVCEGKIGLKFLESRTNLKEVLVLINSADLELIKEINQGILSSQKGRVRGTPIPTPTKNSPFVKKVKPENELPIGRFGFATPNVKLSMRQIRSPQLCLSESLPKPVPLAALADLSAEQRLVVETVLSGESLFFTGGAGTGKSFLIKKLISLLPVSTTAVTASTGVAACHIGGTTLHQFLSLGREDSSVSSILFRIRRLPDRLELLRRTKILILDEISLVDSKLFELIHEILSQIRGSKLSFGGVQLILSGDFLQLPPVTGLFCFESKIWKKNIKKKIHLTTIFRQNGDPIFAEILNEIRMGTCCEETARKLFSRISNSKTNDIKLVPLNKEVAAINDSSLAKLVGAEGQTFTAIDTCFEPSIALDILCPVKSVFSLTVGARVMLVATVNATQKLVNGAIGTLVSFGKSGAGPFVQFPHTERPICINTHEWVFKQAGKEVGRRRQIPLVLAWAVSIHKSQGMTLDTCQVSLEKIFQPGQAYVALSRCTSLEGLSLIGDNTSVKSIQNAVRAHPSCLAFYNQDTVEHKNQSSA